LKIPQGHACGYVWLRGYSGNREIFDGKTRSLFHTLTRAATFRCGAVPFRQAPDPSQQFFRISSAFSPTAASLEFGIDRQTLQDAVLTAISVML
jgi:hypothetical protein